MRRGGSDRRRGIPAKGFKNIAVGHTGLPRGDLGVFILGLEKQFAVGDGQHLDHAGHTGQVGQVAIDLGVYGAPETFVIDAQGVIRFKHVGALTEDIIRTRIVPLLEAGR